MKICPVCNKEMPDNRVYCSNCGAKMDAAPQQAAQAPQQNIQLQNGAYNNYYAQPPVPAPYDHTNEFDAKDVSDNKVFALAIYLTGVVGLVIALFACKDSEYIRFHIRQYMKMLVANAFLAVAAVVLIWTVIAPMAALVCSLIIEVLQIIAFFQAACGKSKEPAILRDLKCFK